MGLSHLLGWSSLIFFMGAASLYPLRIPLDGPVERIILGVLLLYGQVIAAGQILSLGNQLANPLLWLFLSIFFLGLSWWFSKKHGREESSTAQAQESLRQAPFSSKASFHLLATTLLLTTALNLFSVVTALPHNADSMSYHLARAAYYLQFSSLDHYSANYWAQDAHAHNSAILQVYILGVLGSERLTQMAQFLAYWGAGLVVYGLGRELGGVRIPAATAMAVFLLYIENLMEAVTPQNDLLLTFFSGAAVYWLVRFRTTQRPAYVMGGLLSAALAMGTKASFLLEVPVWLVFLLPCILKRNDRKEKTRIGLTKRLAFAGALLLMALLLFGDGIGYWNNAREWGHPLGPDYVRKTHTFEGQPLTTAIAEGGKNLLRLGLDFVSFDGLNHFPLICDLQISIKEKALLILKKAGIDLLTGPMIVPFVISRPSSDEDFSWWGVLGFTLVPLGLLLSLRRGLFHGALAKRLLWGGLLFTLAQAFAGPYDPWRGRYFIFLGLLWTPFVVPLFQNEPGGKTPFRHASLLAILILGCASAVFAIVFRDFRPISLGLGTSRMEQFTARGPDTYLDPLSNFERLVPTHASVILCLPQNTYEYPLFGQGLTRTLIPCRAVEKYSSFLKSPLFWVYALDTRGQDPIRPLLEDDIALGNGWFLREWVELGSGASGHVFDTPINQDIPKGR